MIAAMMHTCTADELGVVRCSGANEKGHLGDGTTIDRMEPVVIDGLGPVARIAGEDPVCALTTVGEVYCWGEASWGAIGDGAKQSRDRPSKVLMLPPAIAIAGDGGRNCALTRDGEVFCWGRDPELDGGHAERSLTLPEPVDVPRFVELGVGHSHACGRTGEGRVMCWGRNNWGQLGDGTDIDRPSVVDVIDVLDAEQIAVGGFHSCARLVDGTVRCWGRDMHPRCAEMSPVDDHLMCPNAQPIAGVGDAVQITAGGDHACALTSSGVVICWGAGPEGQLGGEPRAWPQPYPTELPTLNGATFIAAGTWRTCGRMPDASLRCVGQSFVGREGGKARYEIMAAPE